MNKIFVIDDHTIFCMGLKTIIESNFICDCVETFTNEEIFCEAIRNERPFLIIVDHILTKITGLELIYKVKSIQSDIKSILISSVKDNQLKYLCMEYGVEGYIYKSETESNIVTAIQTIIDGGTYYSNLKKNTLDNKNYDKMNPFSKLTQRELEIVGYLVKGYQHPEIAECIGISTKTIHNHCSNITQKLGKFSQVQLARQAYLWGIIKEEDLDFL